MFRLILLFTLLPALELFLLLQIGSVLGAVPTVLLIVFTGLVGGWLAKREGLAVLRRLTDSLRDGLPPAAQIAEGALVVAGGLLLVTPGVVTDIAGFAFIFGPSRRVIAPVVLRWLAARFQIETSTGIPRPVRPPTARPADPEIASHFDHPVP